MISLVGTKRQGVGYRNKPDAGFGMEYLAKMLELVRWERTASGVYLQSPYRFKLATLKMIRWCVDKGFIKRREDWGDKRGSRKNSKKLSRPFVFYHITQRGLLLLEMIR